MGISRMWKLIKVRPNGIGVKPFYALYMGHEMVASFPRGTSTDKERQLQLKARAEGFASKIIGQPITLEGNI